MVKFKQARFNFYCYTRLKMDMGLWEHKYDSINPYYEYESIYKRLDIEADRLLDRLGERVLPVRSDWLKTRKDYLGMILAIIDEQKVIGWITILAVFAATKIIVRRYKECNPLFASMLCVEMLIVFNKLDRVGLTSTKTCRGDSWNYWLSYFYKNTYTRIGIVSVCSCYCLYRLLSVLKN